MGTYPAQRRRALLRRLLQSGAASTPKNLRLLLEAHGFAATPRTVARDLSALRRDGERGRLQELWRALSEPLRN